MNLVKPVRMTAVSLKKNEQWGLNSHHDYVSHLLSFFLKEKLCPLISDMDLDPASATGQRH